MNKPIDKSVVNSIYSIPGKTVSFFGSNTRKGPVIVNARKNDTALVATNKMTSPVPSKIDDILTLNIDNNESSVSMNTSFKAIILTPEEAFAPIDQAWLIANQSFTQFGKRSFDYIKAKKKYLQTINAFIDIHYANAQFLRKEDPIIIRLKNLHLKIQTLLNRNEEYDLQDLEIKGVSPKYMPRPISREPIYGTFIVEFPTK